MHHVQDACLFDHSPSPQRCARDGGVWDDTWAATVERGGACIAAEEAAQRLAAGGADLEAVDVKLSSDGWLSGFLPEGLVAPDTIRCLTQQVRGVLALSQLCFHEWVTADAHAPQAAS